ncbi:DUF3592 domain-containing protein [Aquipuribacter sp. SD81]|uniref:DUF3592 domain-containing protein n=1 Tax=Aquipuribacter sp. SD81 TaxID=3127703 RepID=UPI003019AE0A
MATLWQPPTLALAIVLSAATAIGVVVTIVSFSLADDLRNTGTTATATATSDTRSGGRASLSRVDVRFTTQDGEVVDTTLEEPSENLQLGDEIEVVYDPEDPWEATALGDEARTAWIVALVTAVFAIGSVWEWARWANRRWADTSLRGVGRQAPQAMSAAEIAAKKKRALRRRRKKRNRRGR